MVPQWTLGVQQRYCCRPRYSCRLAVKYHKSSLNHIFIAQLSSPIHQLSAQTPCGDRVYADCFSDTDIILKLPYFQDVKVGRKDNVFNCQNTWMSLLRLKNIIKKTGEKRGVFLKNKSIALLLFSLKQVSEGIKFATSRSYLWKWGRLP